jgi:MFS family permease
MKRLALPRALSSLAVRNYRLYFFGQTASVAGNWMQNIAMAWLVLRLTGSSFALGATVALQAAPYLIVGPWGGLIADRLPKRKLLIWTQLGQVVAPLSLWGLTETGTIRLWMVLAIVTCRGVLQTIDNPARQSIVSEIVGRDRIVNAVSLNATITQAGRLIGPAIASVVIATIGLSFCFLLNAVSFLCMVAMLLAMRADELVPLEPARKGAGQVRAALSHVRRNQELRMPLIVLAVVGLLSFNFTVVLPAVAKFTFHGTATTYALMANALAIGALVGALVASVRVAITPKRVAAAAFAFGATLGIAAAANSLPLALVALTAVGAASTTFSTAVQTTLQLNAAPEMLGRVLSLYQILYQGTTPIGALIVGALAETAGARSGLALGAAGGLAAGAYGLWSTRSTQAPIEPRLETP